MKDDYDGHLLFKGLLCGLAGQAIVSLFIGFFLAYALSQQTFIGW